MALRNIRYENDPILRKKARPVKEITSHILTLLDDMAETMRAKSGVGLAATQVGVLKRIIVIDMCVVEDENEGVIELINPEIIEMSGAQRKPEGCLSLPGRKGVVERPEFVSVRALDRNGEEFTVEGEGLMAVVLCHELDHLDGVLYVDKALVMKDDEEEFDDEFEDDDDEDGEEPR